MRTHFPLFNTPIDLNHKYWKELVKIGDTVIDATCGNGQDTLLLAKLALSPDKGCVYALDLQKAAIDASKRHLSLQLPIEIFNKVCFIQGCHSQFPAEITANSIKLIVYNLGYLPGSDKTLTTTYDTTLESLLAGLNLLTPGGVISLTCYPGHAEGQIEEDKIIETLLALDPKIWSLCHHRWINRRKAPSLVLLQKQS